MIDRDRLADDLYLMDKGVRDCCWITIGGTPDEIEEQLYEIESQALEYKYHIISFKLEEEDDREYRAVYICKYNYQKILLAKLYNEVKPHSFIYEYMMGTLLGYSAASMEEFLMRKCTDIAIGAYQCTNECKEDPEEIEEKAKVTIEGRLSEFDKDAWQVLMSLNNNCTPVSEKINTLLDLLYTHTDDPKEKNLLHNLTVAMPNRNKPDFSPCIEILERYFHVDTEDEETDTSSAGYTNESVDPYRQIVNKLYNDLVDTRLESEFVSILNKFLEKEPSYRGYKNFQNSLKWEIENEYGKAYISLPMY